VTALCGTKEYLIGELTNTTIEALLESLHGTGSWQQSIAFGTALNQIPNSNSLVTTGIVASGTFAETALLDGTYWQIQDDAGALDVYFEFLISADGVPTGLTHNGRIQGSGDDLNVEAYNWGMSTWEPVGVLVGANPSNDSASTYSLFQQHVGTGPNLGKVRVRFSQAAGLTSANFYSDQVVLSYAVLNRSVGYADGAIWVDTINGGAGAVAFINGVADNPCSTWADALLLSVTLGMSRFRIAGGSVITLSANSDNYAIIGNEYTLDLNGQSVANALVIGASVDGISAGLDAKFIECKINTVSLTQCSLIACALADVITALTAGTYLFDRCYSGVAGTGSPVFDFTIALGDTNLNMRHYSGGVEVRNMGQTGADRMSLEGDGQLIIANTCAGGEIAIRGHFPLTDNAGGVVTISDAARYDEQQIRDAMKLAPTAGAPAAGSVDEHLDEILADTATIVALPAAVDAVLSAAHGAGNWEGADVVTVKQNFVLDFGIDTFKGQVWCEQGNAILPATSVTTSVYDEAGALLFAVASSSPDAQGVFQIVKTTPTNIATTTKAYYTISVFVVPVIGSVTSGLGVAAIASA